MMKVPLLFRNVKSLNQHSACVLLHNTHITNLIFVNLPILENVGE